MATEHKTRSREYLRVSRDKSGRERSVGEQADDNRTAATEQGWTLGAPYVDNDVSASRYARKVRGDFGKLLADLEHGRFAADVLIMWESSRGSRRVGEWVSLIELCEQAKVRIFVTTHARAYDPANPRDRRGLLEDAVDSEYESAKVSLRSRRAAAATAAAGRPHGRVPYGYRRTRDPLTGRVAGQEPDPVEAPVVREMYSRLARGESLRQVARDLAAHGARTRSGLVFSPQHVRYLVLRHSYAGQRVHVPAASARERNAATETVPAVWPALVPLDTWHAVRARLTAPERRTSRPGRAVNVYSMIVACDVCGGPLTVRYARGADRGEYSCRDGSHVRIGKADLETLLDKVVCAYLADPRQYETLAAAGDHGDELQAVRGELAAARAEVDELRDQVGTGRLSVASLARAEPAMLARTATLEGRERELGTPFTLAGIITPGRDVARRWKAAPVAAKREVARLLLSPVVLGQARVTRSPSPGHAVPAHERVTWRREDGVSRADRASARMF